MNIKQELIFPSVVRLLVTISLILSFSHSANAAWYCEIFDLGTGSEGPIIDVTSGPSCGNACEEFLGFDAGCVSGGVNEGIEHFVCRNGGSNLWPSDCLDVGTICPPGYEHDAVDDKCVPEVVIAEKNVGPGQCDVPGTPMTPNPIHMGTGNKYWQETDYTAAGTFALRFERYYNSDASITSTRIGANWRHNYNRTIIFPDANTADVFRVDGKVYQFTLNGSNWIADTDIIDRLEELTDGQGSTTGWQYTTADDSIELYDANGKLLSISERTGFNQLLDYDVASIDGGDDNSNTLDKVTGPFGRVITFTYNTNGRVSTLTDPAGEEYHYDYDSNGNLTTITYPDETPANSSDNPIRQYHYEDVNFPNALTGITDETGNRYSNYAYDSQGRAIISELAGGAERIEVTYNVNSSSTTTDALGNVRTYVLDVINGVVKTHQIDGGPCSTCGQSQAMSYDTNGFLASRTDFNGNVTTFVNNSRGLQESRTEAVGTADERTITTQWHTNFRLPTLVTGSGKTTAFSYDSAGRLLTRTETDTATSATRTTTNDYFTATDFGGNTTDPRIGLLKSIDGPRTNASDITTFTYDTQGNLIKTTNALSQETNITGHDAHGRPVTIEDPNGTQITLSYDARGRLLTRTIDSKTTTFDYDGVGNITKTTLPNGTFLKNTYDAAQRLTTVEDNLGNKITYTLDAMGNRTKEDVEDPGQVLTRTLSRTYNSLNQLITSIGGANQSTTFAYDANGNQITATVDPTGLNQATQQAFDALNRLQTATDAKLEVTNFAYDARDNLVNVTDPTGLVTTYSYDGLDNLTQQNSPDTGTTSYTYDVAGNRVTQTDERSIITNFSYDALNRLTSIDYPDNTQDVSFTYDQGTNGIGRLTTMNDAAGTMTYSYDARGNLVTQTTTMDDINQSISYAYNDADQLIQITYPSSRTVDYQRNVIGQVISVTTTFDGQTETLANNINYKPFGPMSGFTFGNGLVNIRAYDLDYRLTGLTTMNGSNLQDLSFVSDAANNFTSINNLLDNTRNQVFDYDELNRVTDATGIYGDIDYSYDANGNRLNKTVDTVSETYTYDTSSGGNHHLLETINGGTRTYSYDANGNTNDNGIFSFTYGDNNRLKEVKSGVTTIATYTYNGRDERVKKDVNGEVTYYHYDQSGQLIAESNAAGEIGKEYVYLDGIPLAIIDIQNVSDTPVVFDNDNCGYVVDGDWSLESTVSGFEGINYRQASAGNGTSRSTWRCETVTPGDYRVFAKWTAAADRANNASYTINHTGGSDTVTVNQQQNGGQFNLLGMFNLDANSTIRLTDAANGTVVADAIQLINTDVTMSVNFVHPDHLNTPQLITDSTQAVVWQADYDPFGKATVTTGTITNNLRFTGQYFDEETGLHHNGFRTYDPSIGRYIQSDPIGLIGGINSYLYVVGNPIMLIDPFGLVLTTQQQTKIVLITSVGAGLGSLTGNQLIAGTAGAVFGGVATFFEEGRTIREVANNTLTGFISGFSGSGLAKLISQVSKSGIDEALKTGVLSGTIDFIGLHADPIIPNDKENVEMEKCK